MKVKELFSVVLYSFRKKVLSKGFVIMHLAFIGIFLITLGIGLIIGFTMDTDGITDASIIIIDESQDDLYHSLFEQLIDQNPSFSKYDIRDIYTYSKDSAIEQVRTKTKQAVIVMSKNNDIPNFEIITYDYSNTSLRDSIVTDLASFHQKIYMIKNGIDEAQFYTPIITKKALNPNAQTQEEVSVMTLICTAIIILVSMICFPALTVVSNDIIYEKADRTIELVVSSISTRNLYLSKILVGFLLVLTEVLIIVILGMIGILTINAFSTIPVFASIAGSINTVSLIYKLLVFGIYLALMLCLYLILVIILSSLTTDVETAGYLLLIAILPMTVFSYMSLSVPLNPSNSFFTTLLTYLPLSSGFTLPVKIMLDLANPLEIIFSTLLLIISIVLIYYFGEGIFKKNIIKYSNKNRKKKLNTKLN